MKNPTEPEPEKGFNPDGSPEFSGIFVPRIVLEDERLSATDRILFGLIDGLAKSERGFFASNAYVARTLRLTGRAVQQSLKRLESVGYISRRVGLNGRRTVTTVSSRALRNASFLGRNKLRGGAKNISRGGEKYFAHIYKGIEKTKPSPLTPPPNRVSARKKGIDYSGGF